MNCAKFYIVIFVLSLQVMMPMMAMKRKRLEDSEYRDLHSEDRGFIACLCSDMNNRIPRLFQALKDNDEGKVRKLVEEHDNEFMNEVAELEKNIHMRDRLSHDSFVHNTLFLPILLAELTDKISDKFRLDTQQAIQLLLKAGVQVQTRNIDEGTILHELVTYVADSVTPEKLRDSAVIKTLLEADPTLVNKLNIKGETALSCAVDRHLGSGWGNDSKSKITFLLDAGAKVKKVGNNFIPYKKQIPSAYSMAGDESHLGGDAGPLPDDLKNKILSRGQTEK